MKKVIIIDASPRKKGNSYVITEKLAAEIKDAEIEVFKISEKKINPCMACAVCQGKETPMCVQKDDMSDLIAKIDACDALVLASPIYFHQVSAQAKMFIDRLYCFFNFEKPMYSAATKRGKKAALICSCFAGPVDVYKKYAFETIQSFSVAGVDETRVLICGNVDVPGSCLEKAEYAKEVSAIAAWINE